MTQPANRRLATEAYVSDVVADVTPAAIGAQPAGDYATSTALTSGLATKVNTSTYTAGLAGKQDAATVLLTPLGSGQDDKARIDAAFASATSVLLHGDFLTSGRITLPWTLQRVEFTAGSSITHTGYTVSSKNNTLGLSLHPSDPHNAEDLTGTSTTAQYYRNYIFYRGGNLDHANKQTLTVAVARNGNTFTAPALPTYSDGAWVFITSQDPTSFNSQGEVQGFLRKVISVTAVGDGTFTVMVDRKFPVAMTTLAGTGGRTLEATPVTLAPPVEIIGGDFSQANPMRMFSSLIRLEFCERPIVRDGFFHDGGWNAVNVTGCVGGSISGHAEDLVDDNDGSRYGYYSDPSITQGHLGVAFPCAGPSRDMVFNVTGTRVRHVFSTGPITSPSFNEDTTAQGLFNKYGEPESITVYGRGWYTGSVAWDTHEQGWDILFNSVVATNPGRWASEGTQDANEVGAGIDDRAKRTVFLAPRVINAPSSGIIIADVGRPNLGLDLATTVISPQVSGCGSAAIRIESCAKIYNPTLLKGGASATFGIFVNGSASTVASLILGGRIDMESPTDGTNYNGTCISVGTGGQIPMVGGGITFANADRAMNVSAGVGGRLPGDVIHENVNRLVTRRWNYTASTTVPILRRAHPFKPDVRVASGPQTVNPTTETVKQIWLLGDEYWYTDPAASGALGMICTTAGTPGTWKTFGTISA